MEKGEIEIKSGKVEMCFFYSEDLVATSELANYKYWLELCSQAIDKNFYTESKPITMNISIVTDEEIKEINEEHREKNKVTDVLSFPMQENMRGGDYDDFSPIIELGDIIICKSVCENQALEFKISYFEEFVHLIIHGFLHVYGYDHEISMEEEKIMFGLEEQLVLAISNLKMKTPTLCE